MTKPSGMEEEDDEDVHESQEVPTTAFSGDAGEGDGGSGASKRSSDGGGSSIAPASHGRQIDVGERVL